jgi:alcohol-forming fatty acyl-CoA reductase
MLLKTFHRLTSFAPNTYTFTKHMAEQVCIDFKKSSDLPIIIYRPSIVSVSEIEPVSGWCDNFNGPMALIFVGALGLNHVTTCDGNSALDVIPVDICVKGLIVSPFSYWKKEQKDKIPIFNAASIKVLTYNSMAMDISLLARLVPSVNMFGLPHITYTTCVYYAWLIRIFRNILPALILDGILKITGNKPKLMKIQRIKVNAENALQYFYQHNFRFNHFNFIDLNLDIPAHEKDEFSINDKYVMNNRTFYVNALRTCKKVLLKETEQDEEIARKRYPYIYVITRTIHLLFLYTCYKVLQFVFNRFVLTK